MQSKKWQGVQLDTPLVACLFSIGIPHRGKVLWWVGARGAGDVRGIPGPQAAQPLLRGDPLDHRHRVGGGIRGWVRKNERRFHAHHLEQIRINWTFHSPKCERLRTLAQATAPRSRSGCLRRHPMVHTGCYKSFHQQQPQGPNRNRQEKLLCHTLEESNPNGMPCMRWTRSLTTRNRFLPDME